ncbi:helix-turn-helix domain-containing protein [Tahibacter harae]|uniref:Helix-turn-helix domain-containing protein n=1 Tax=Tahibacter harae TaxID=2963937 RepID=A0ABT1QQH3_9GAMM|nr:helix-turn-helix domain-containing protein [Tahibacter harae]MCQ4164531.1 helix-turn-helix domain-containing protein [Tahibacter harae]
MPNIATAFKEEISRLCRKEMRKHLDPLRKASIAYRKEISALKRKLQESEKRLGAMAKRSSKISTAAAAETAAPERQTRFVAKGLKTLRARLGLSAAELAALLGVTGQSVYNWEQKKSTPRAAQLVQLAQLRSMGKKAVRAQLEGTAVEAEGEAKLRRGRKPRAAAETGEAAAKPRRGRKPRVAAEGGEAVAKPRRQRKARAAAEQSPAAAPKRRGRKPRVAREAVEAEVAAA